MKEPMVEVAVSYAKKGLAVFSLAPGSKVPIKGSAGWKDATTDEKEIRQMFASCPEANIGIATGKISGIIVVDVDVKSGAQGEETLEKLLKQHGPLPKTPCCITPSGGYHYYFKYPEGVDIPCSQGKLGPGIDIRSDGGYVVAPPSVIADKLYVWEVTGDIDDVEACDAP